MDSALRKMGKIFAFCNQKGGVGKTTTAVNLSAGVAELGKKVLLIDVDPQGNATSGLGHEQDSASGTTYDVIVGHKSPSQVIVGSGLRNLDLVKSNPHLSGAEIELVGVAEREFILKRRFSDVVDKYEFVFIDCPPSLGILTVSALTMCDGGIIPLQCEYYALEGLGQLLETYRLVKEKLNPKLELSGVILTMADFRTNLTQQVIDDVRNHFGDKVFRTVIPRSVKISEAPSFGKPVVHYDPNCKGSVLYRQAASEFLERFSPRSGERVLAVSSEPGA